MKGPNNSQSLVEMPLSEELPKSLIYLIKYYPIYLAVTHRILNLCCNKCDFFFSFKFQHLNS